MRTGSVLRAALAVAVLAPCAPALGGLTHTADIILTTDTGAIVTNAYVGGAPEPRQVFSSVMGDLVPGITADPGFDCFPGTFPANSSNGFRILDALRVWNGDDFSTLAADRLGVSFLTLGPVFTPDAPDTIVEGFLLPVQSGGLWHRHLTYALDNGAPAGVYLLQLQLRSTNVGVAPSEPFWLVFENDANPNDFGEAFAWAQANLGGAPPDCPGDTNGDNIVNFADLNGVLANFGQSGDDLPGDVNNDAVVNFADLNGVLANFGDECD